MDYLKIIIKLSNVIILYLLIFKGLLKISISKKKQLTHDKKYNLDEKF